MSHAEENSCVIAGSVICQPKEIRPGCRRSIYKMPRAPSI